MPVSASFARILAAGRETFNARVVEAQRRVPGFDGAVFAALLEHGVDGVVAAVTRVASDRSMVVGVAAYDIALTLVARRLAGLQVGGSPVERLWSDVLPTIAARIAEDPLQVMGSLSNAVVHMTTIDGARVDEWLDRMTAQARGATTTEALLDLGKVLAWRAGAAHYRNGALSALERLPEPLARAAVDAPDADDWPTMRSRLAGDPWWTPQARRSISWSVGAFTGFGGTFDEPPDLRASADGFVVKSGTRFHQIVADGWGAVLLPSTVEVFEAGAPGRLKPSSHEGNRLVVGGRTLELDLPADGLVLVADRDTLAIASRYSHLVRLMPLR